MTSEKTKWWKTPPYSNIVGTLTSAFILWIVKLVYDGLNQTTVFLSIGDVLIYIYRNLISFINYPIPFGLVIGLFIIYFITYSFRSRKFAKKLKALTPNDEEKMYVVNPKSKQLEVKKTKPPTDKKINEQIKAIPVDPSIAKKAKLEKQLAYTADKFLGYTWEWKWIANYKINQYEAKYIKPCCPNPNCKQHPMYFLSEATFSYSFQCELCHKITNITYVGMGSIEQEVDRLIMLNVLHL